MHNIHTEKRNRLSAEKTKLAQIAWSVKEKNKIDKPKTCEKNNFIQNNDEENYEDLDDLEANGIDDFHEESEESIDDLHDHFSQNQAPTLFNAYKLEESFIT